MIHIATSEELDEKLKEDKAFLCTIEEEVYHKSYPMSQSLLKEYRYSPAHYRYRATHPMENIPAFEIGRAVHCYVCEGKPEFDKRYVLRPKFDRRTKKGKEEMAEWETKNAGVSGLDPDDHGFCSYLSEKVISDPVIGNFFNGGHAEVAAFAPDPESGLWMKAKADKWHPDKKVIVDLKTTGKKATAESFNYSIREYGYYIQAAYYMDIFTLASGEEQKNFVIVAVEKGGPCGMKPFILSQEWLDIGRAKYKKWLRIHNRCQQENHWPGYDTKVEVSTPPHWMMRDEGC